SPRWRQSTAQGVAGLGGLGAQRWLKVRKRRLTPHWIPAFAGTTAGGARPAPPSARLMAAAQRNEGDDLAAEDVGARDALRAARVGLLDHLQNMLRAWRADRNDHDSAGAQLLQERRRDVVDAAGDDDLVERRRLRPAVIAVAAPRRDVAVFVIALADQPVVDAAGAPRELGDDLDRIDAGGQVGQQGRLEARAGADLEH